MDERRRIEELERENDRLRRRLDALSGTSSSATAARLDRLLGDRVLLENLPDFVSVLDADMRVVYLNRTIPGRTVDEMIGTSSIEHLADDHRRRFIDHFEAAWSSGSPAEFEFRTLSDFRWVSRFIPIREAGATVYILVATEDVTARRRVEESLRESETRLRQVIEASGMGTWSWYVDGDSVQWDPRLRTIFGVGDDGEQLTYERYLAFVPEPDRARVVESIASALETGVYEDLEHRIVRPDGTVRFVLCKGFVMRSDDGRLLGLRGSVFDVTERRRLEDELRHVQQMEAIGRLTSGIAHNFNNLLGIIIPSVDLARNGPRDAIGQRLDDIEHAASRAAEMVRDLMLFARGGGAVVRRSEDPVALVRRTLAIAKTTFGPTIALELQIDADVPPVLVNAGQIEQVLLNICLNARDALEERPPEERHLGVRVRTRGETCVLLEIVDNGPGMDEVTRSRVFEPFFTTKTDGRGTGLGLASAYAILHEHGGRIVCASTEGIGTRFTIELPAARGPRRESLLPAAPTKKGGNERILLVDDEADFRRIARAILEPAGFSVVEAADGIAGLERLEAAEAPFDLVIVDGAMPRLSGEDFVAELRRRGAGPPALLLSGHPVAGKQPLADAILAKPVSVETLLAAVRATIDADLTRDAS